MTTGIQIVGNSGVGKSFIGNVILGRRQFEHREDMTAVTTAMESANTSDNQFTVFNIPGLIEADPTSIQRNKQEIERAFLQCPNSRILVVFTGGVGGRLQEQDVQIYKALSRAFNFQMESTIFVINKITRSAYQNTEYRSAAMGQLRSLLQLPTTVTDGQFVFIPLVPEDKIDDYHSEEHRSIKSDIMSAINVTTARIHAKERDIQLQADRIRQMERENQERQRRIEEEQRAQAARLQEEQQRQARELQEKQRQMEEAQRERDRNHGVRLDFHGFKVGRKRIW